MSRSCRARSKARSTGPRTRRRTPAGATRARRGRARVAAHPAARGARRAGTASRHYELYYGVSGMGAVMHTINPRLFPDQLQFIVNHAEDRYVFFDLTFAALVE